LLLFLEDHNHKITKQSIRKQSNNPAMKTSFARALLASTCALALCVGPAAAQPRLRGVQLPQEPSAAPSTFEASMERTLQNFDSEGEALGAEEDLESFGVGRGVEVHQRQDVADADSRALQGLVMSDLERQNAGYIQRLRKQRGLQALTFSPDLVKEAQRWSRVMAGQGRVSNRNPTDLNIALPWSSIGELPGKYQSVASSGAVSSLKNHPYLLDPRYNRIGVGIVKSAKDGAYYMTILLKAV
jgi:uncharacterized protein YkwD